MIPIISQFNDADSFIEDLRAAHGVAEDLGPVRLTTLIKHDPELPLARLIISAGYPTPYGLTLLTINCGTFIPGTPDQPVVVRANATRDTLAARIEAITHVAPREGYYRVPGDSRQ